MTISYVFITSLYFRETSNLYFEFAILKAHYVKEFFDAHKTSFTDDNCNLDNYGSCS